MEKVTEMADEMKGKERIHPHEKVKGHKGTNVPRDRETGKPGQTDENRCRYENCKRSPEKDSDFCIFHMPAREKENAALWKKCMDGFNELVEIGEGDFRGFVLRDVDLTGRVIEQEVDFTGAEFFGVSSFSVKGKKTEFKIVAIGISTGGPQALEALLSGFPKDFPAPLLIVQHIATGFIAGLAEWLKSNSALEVQVAKAGDYVRKSTVLFAPDECSVSELSP